MKEIGWQPSTITADFEIALIKALKETFSQLIIGGCNFHFCQSLWKHIQSIGLTTDYRNNDEIKLHVRMCAALAHLPEQDIDDGWLYIQESSPPHPKLQEFYDYFVNEWLAIKPSMWNCHQL